MKARITAEEGQTESARTSKKQNSDKAITK